MTNPDWRKDEDYAFTEKLNNAGWAWEFLRRNKKYKKSWDAYRLQAAEYEKEFGLEWRKERPTWRYDPPLIEDETPSEWKWRCIKSEADFEELSFESFCAKPWGLALRMPDPSIPFYEQEEPVRFIKPLKYPWFIVDEVEFNSLTAKDDILQYWEVKGGYAVVAFDLSSSIDRQLKDAKKQLLAKAKDIEKKRDRRDLKAWRRYLRALDAKTQGAKLKEIGDAFCLTPEKNKFELQSEANNAKSLLARANKLVANHLTILVPFSGKNKNTTLKK